MADSKEPQEVVYKKKIESQKNEINALRTVLLSLLKEGRGDTAGNDASGNFQQRVDSLVEDTRAVQLSDSDGELVDEMVLGEGEEINKLESSLDKDLDSDYKGDAEDGAEDDTDSENDATDDDDDDLPEAIYDKQDGVYRCTECNWEVVDNECSYCGSEHVVMVYKDQVDNSEDPFYDPVATEFEAINPDRRLVPRGTTPLLPVGRLPDADVPAIYFPPNRGGKDEFRELLSRGATREMCDLYKLEFEDEHGIVAWATDEIFEEFAGPEIRSGDLWKIYLGRCFRLERADKEGTLFVETVLEEALFYPLHNLGLCPGEQWVTMLESSEPRIWATKPRIENVADATPYPEDESEMDGDAYAAHCKAIDALNAKMDEELGHCDTESEVCELELEPRHKGPVKAIDDYQSDDGEDSDWETESDDEPGSVWPVDDVDSRWCVHAVEESESSDESLSEEGSSSDSEASEA